MPAAYNDKWDVDYAKLFGGTVNVEGKDVTYYGDINISVQEQKGLNDAVSAYHTAMKKVEQTGNAMVAFTMLAWLMANQGFKQLNYQAAIDGGGLKVQGDITALNGDLEDMTNQTDDATATQNSSSSGDGYTYSNYIQPENKSYLYLVAERSEDLYKKLEINGTGWDQDLTNILGSDASNSLSENFLSLRQMIYVNGMDNNGTDYYFNADERAANPPWDPTTNGRGHMDSFCQFQIDLEVRGDLYDANEAMKKKTDALNENTSTTQSTNAASQELISKDNNKSKAVEAFVVAMFHAIVEVMSAANKAMARG